ncbi:MAG: hypothetical protein WAU07_05340 [Microgenomates group bacterium]
MSFWFKNILLIGFLIAFLGMAETAVVFASESQPSKLGIHILHPLQIPEAKSLVSDSSENWQYVTVPITLADLERKDIWEQFFAESREHKIIPIVRLATSFEDESWQIPTKHNVVVLLDFLQEFSWPTDQKHIIIFNEVNHATEWQGTIAPEEYAAILEFSADWAHTENAGFVVLPAAMDLAAPNGLRTAEAFTYWNKVLAERPEIVNKIDAWNSHSYPNPAFTASPKISGKNRIDGFLYELAFLEKYTSRELPVYITETGWRDTSLTSQRLSSYYQYAHDHIWSDERVVAVTPFVLQGAPGPFAEFSFLDEASKPTMQGLALRALLESENQTAYILK